ncbi:hypothetical protein KBB17_00245 [Candidatus Saccharibacteria bacterium]|nr:hypothetical protein [Candidatus Saccharibacteria bacterium]MBP9131697.1 hypothetical protein [Candidatus Saccharibacteria bacterium]
MDKNRIKRLLKELLAWLMIFTGVVFGALPLIPAWGLIIAGVFLFRTTRPADWQPPETFRKFVPKRFAHRIFHK